MLNIYKIMLLSHQDDLMAELEELEQEDLDAQLLEISGPAVDELPSVPTAEPSSSSKTHCLTCMVLAHVQWTCGIANN